MENSEFSLQEVTIEKKFPKIHKIENFDTLNKLSKEENSVKVEMGGCTKIEEDIVYSFGANPCLVALTINKKGEFYLLHSNGNDFDLSQKKILDEAVKGVVGGGQETLLEYSETFRKKNFKILSPNNNNQDFNVVVLPKKIPNFLPAGIFYHYGDVQEEFENNFEENKKYYLE